MTITDADRLAAVREKLDEAMRILGFICSQIPEEGGQSKTVSHCEIRDPMAEIECSS